MNFRSEIYNILRAKGVMITTLETNKIIFSIATLGLFIGKEELLEIAINSSTIERGYFEHRILSLLDYEEEREIANTVFKFIPETIDGRILIYVVEIVLKFDLKHIVLDLGIYDYSVNNSDYKEYSISTVQWINFLVAEIFRVHGGKSLLNNDCGTGDFVISMLNSGYAEKAIGIAHNKSDLSIIQIKKYFLNKDLEIRDENSFFSPALQGAEKVDMVYCTYPLIYKYEKEETIPMIYSWDFYFDFKKKYSANLLWMINALQSIKDDGIVVAFVANGTLFNGIDEDIRRYLVTNNYIDTIISLPKGILPYNSGVASSLVILKKNRYDNYSIRMIDASEFSTEHRRYKYFSNADMEYIVQLYTSDKHIGKSLYVSLNEIMLNDAYLGMNRYCTNPIENAVTLDSVTDKIFRGYQLNAKELDNLTPDDGEETEYRIINISDIQPEGFVSNNLNSIKADDKKKYDKFVVEDGDIIITAKNTTIKSAIYRKNENYKAVLSGNLIAIRVNPKKINPYYLKAFIDSEKGDMAIKSIQTGTSIITINANSLKDMKISLLSMSEQEIIGSEYKKNLDLIINLLEKYKIAVNHSNQIFDEVRKKMMLEI